MIFELPIYCVAGAALEHLHRFGPAGLLLVVLATAVPSAVGAVSRPRRPRTFGGNRNVEHPIAGDELNTRYFSAGAVGGSSTVQIPKSDCRFLQMFPPEVCTRTLLEALRPCRSQRDNFPVYRTRKHVGASNSFSPRCGARGLNRILKPQLLNFLTHQT